MQVVQGSIKVLIVLRVGESHQIECLPVFLVLGIKGVVELHDLEEGGHGMVVQALPICDILNLARELFKANQDLLNILQVTIVLSSEALEFLLKPVSGLSCLTNHLRQVLPQLELIFGQSHDIDRHILVLFPEHVALSYGNPLVHFEDLLG